MSAPPAVRQAREDERDVVAGVLHDAFIDEGGLNYWLRQGRDKERARRRFFHAAVRKAVHPGRTLWLAEAEAPLGAAIWLAPGQHAYDYTPLQQLALTPLLLSIAGVSGMSRALALGERLAHCHPRAPHAHLTFLGVASAAQGRGVGSALLKSACADLDAAGTLAFLETTTARNVALYQRHGFEVSHEFNVSDVTFWTMERAPR